MTNCKLLRTYAATAVCSLLVTLVMAHGVHAERIYAALVIDPPTTAFSGVPAVDGLNGLSSNRSGPGTWHLYAIDNLNNNFNFGFQAFNIQLVPGPGGTIPSSSNRLPETLWDDSATFGNGNGPFSTGFNNNRTSIAGLFTGANLLFW